MDISGCAYSVDEDMRYMVYRWGFPYLDYPLEISISWIYLLSLYNWFYRFCTSHRLVPLTCFGVYDNDTIFNAYFWFVIDTRVLIPARHLAFITPLVGEFLTPLDMSRSPSLDRGGSFCWGPSLLCGAGRLVVAPVPSFFPLVGSWHLLVARDQLL